MTADEAEVAERELSDLLLLLLGHDIAPRLEEVGLGRGSDLLSTKRSFIAGFFCLKMTTSSQEANSSLPTFFQFKLRAVLSSFTMISVTIANRCSAKNSHTYATSGKPNARSCNLCHFLERHYFLAA